VGFSDPNHLQTTRKMKKILGTIKALALRPSIWVKHPERFQFHPRFFLRFLLRLTGALPRVNMSIGLSAGATQSDVTAGIVLVLVLLLVLFLFPLYSLSFSFSPPIPDERERERERVRERFRR
jgi:hypothetical protein